MTRGGRPGGGAGGGPGGGSVGSGGPGRGGRPGGGEGVRGGGGGAPASLGDATLDEWRAASQQAVQANPDGDLSETAGAAGEIEQEASQTDATRRGERPDYDSEAHDAQPPMPEDAPRQSSLDTSAADAAIDALAGIGEQRLSDQALSPAGRPPRPAYLTEADFVPAALARQRETVADLEERLEAGDLTPDQRADLTGQLDAAKAEVARIERQTGEAPAGDPPATITDEGPASLEPLPPGQASILGDAVAHLLGRVETKADEIVGGAVASLQGQSVQAMLDLGETEKPNVASELDGELRGIAEAAGVTEEQLTATIDEQREALHDAEQAQTGEIHRAGIQAANRTAERAAEETREAASARAAVDAENEAKRQAVEPEADTEAIEATRDEYLGRAEQVAARARAGIRASVDRRDSQLDTAATGVKQAAQSTADRQAAAIRRHWSDDSDPNRGTVEARPTTAWGTSRQREIDQEVTRFKAAAAAEADGLRDRITDQLTESRDTIRDWAAAQEGRERSWWERLVDRVTDWWSQADADNEAWERQRNAETRDRMVADLDALTALQQARQSGSREAFHRELSRLGADQRALAQQFFSGGMSSIQFVAESTMARIAARRTPTLATDLEQTAISDFSGLDLGELARARNSDFNPDVLANQVRGAVAGWGTDEDAVHTALGGARTAIERAALRKRYAELFPGRTLEGDVEDDLGSRELERAEALLSGDSATADAASLAHAIEGWGTDEAAIMSALRGKSPEEIEAVRAAYLEMTGETLDVALEGDLGGAELDQARSLASGDSDAADAAELEVAMAGLGTDEAGLRQVFERIRSEEEERARREGLTPAELQQRIRERNDRVTSRFAELGYGDFRTRMTAELADVDESVARRRLDSGTDALINTADIDLMDAMVAGDESGIDAARLDRERRSAWYASDDEIEDVVRNQHARAERDVALDLNVERTTIRARYEAGDLTLAEYRQQMGEWQERSSGEQRDQAVRSRAQENMGGLRQSYAEATGGTHTLDALVEDYTSGYQHDEITALVESGGRLSEDQEIFYAVEGLGTDEDRIREVLRGKTPAEIERVRQAYEDRHPGRSFDDDILGDLSGREDLDIGHHLEYGDPATFGRQLAEAESADERARILAGMRTMLEERRDVERTGTIGQLFALGLDPMNSADQMQAAIEHAEQYVAALDAREDAGDGAPIDPALAGAQARFEITFGGAQEAQEQVRQQIDAYADAAVQVGAAITAIAVTAATFGTAGPAVAAAYGAAAAAAATVAMKAQLRGAAYGWEEAGVDVAVGIVDAGVSAATAGVGGRILDGVEAAVRAQLARQIAMDAGEELTESAVRAFVREAMSEAIEGGIGAMPSAAVEAMLNDDVWRSGDPFGAVMDVAGQAGIMGAGMGVGMHAGGAGLGAAWRGVRGGGSPDVAGSPDVDFDVDRPVDGPVDGIDIDLPPEADPGSMAGRGARAEQPPAGPRPAEAPDRPVPAPEGPPRSTGDPDEVIDLDDPANAHLVEEIDGADPREPFVGEDGIVDLDDPRNRFLVEDRMAGQLPGDAARDPRAAREFFEGFVAAQPGLESALVRNSETGEHIVIQGSPDSVDIRRGRGVWEDLIPPEVRGRGRWELVVHSHPVDSRTGVTPEWARVPSGGGGDFGWSVYQAQTSGRPVMQEIRVTTENGPDVTRYGYDPGHAEPYSIDLPGPDGARETHRFRGIEDYHDWYRERFGGDLREVPEGFGGRRRGDAPAVDPTQETTRPDVDSEPAQETTRPGIDEPAQEGPRPGGASEPGPPRAPTPPGGPVDATGIFDTVPRTDARARGLSQVESLPPPERDALERLLHRLPPERAADVLTRLGTVDPRTGSPRLDPEGLLHAMQDPELRRELGLPELDDIRPDVEVDPDLPVVERGEPYPVRYSGDGHDHIPGTTRSSLKGRMEAPAWAAGDASRWNPHHMIPIEHQGHPVLDALRFTEAGFDINAPENGFALAVSPTDAEAHSVILHQLPGGPDLGGGHPMWNRMVGERLDALTGFIDDPVVLRQKVSALMDELRYDLMMGRVGQLVSITDPVTGTTHEVVVLW